MAARGTFGRSATWTGSHFVDPDDSDLDERDSSGVDEADEDDTLRRWRHEALHRARNGRYARGALWDTHNSVQQNLCAVVSTCWLMLTENSVSGTGSQAKLEGPMG